MEPYFDKYYAIVEEVVAKRDREFAEMFLNALSPATLAREQDETSMTMLLEKTTDETHFFTLFLKKQLETIESMKKARVLCESYQASLEAS